MNSRLFLRPASRWAVVLLLLAGALFQRWHGLADWPAPRATIDEYHYLWTGLTLLHDGRPCSWSGFHEYVKKLAYLGQYALDGNTYYMMRPALDHPPLFSLVAGAFAWVSGAADQNPVTLKERPEKYRMKKRPFSLWRVDLGRARLLTLILFAASFLLLYELGRPLVGFEATLLALILYGFTAHIVLHGRLLVTENLTTPLLLLNLVFAQRYLAGRSRERTFGVVTVLTTAAAILCKLVAVNQAAMVLFYVWPGGRRRAALYPVAGVALGVALLLAYAKWQGWDVFWAVQGAQKARFFGFNALEKLIAGASLVHTPSISYPVLLGWLALIGLALERPTPVGKGSPAVAAPIWSGVLIYLLGFIFFVAAPAIYGWHLTPFYPFLCLALATWMAQTYRACEPRTYAALLALLLPGAFHVMFMGNTAWRPGLRYGYLAIAGVVLAVALSGGGGMRRESIRQCVLRLTLAASVAGIMVGEFWTVWFGTFP